MERLRPGVVRVGKAVAALAAFAVLVRTLAQADLAKVGALVAQRGAWVLVGLVPYAFAVLVDAFGWRTLLGRAARPSFSSLVAVRARCDAFGATLPGGTLIAESLAPAWLRASLPIDAGVAAVAGRKCFVGLTEGVYILASFAVGFGALHARGAALPWIVLGAGTGMLAMFGLTTVGLASGSAAAKIRAALRALPVPPLRRWLDARAHGFSSTDERLATLLRGRPWRLVAAGAMFLGAWTIESVETWVLLRMVGVELPFATVFAFEPSVSLLRSIGCFAPGGLGVQDLGYVAALGALGVPDAVTVGAAFVLLKRAKELAWAVVGYGTLLAPAARAPRASAARAAAVAATAAVLLVALPAWSLGVGVANAAAPSPLFSISKSENKNYVQFVERLDERCAPVGDAPVFAYWRMMEHGPQATEPLLDREQPAYGIAEQTVLARTRDSGTVRVTLHALPSAPLLVESSRASNGGCEARALTPIDGVGARLFNVHAVLRWPFGIAHLLVSGWSLADGHPVRDQRSP